MRVYVHEFHQCRFAAFEPIFFEKEGNEQPIHLERKEIGLCSVEDIVVEVERYFAFHAVRLTQLAYLIEVVGLPLRACGWLVGHVVRGYVAFNVCE